MDTKKNLTLSEAIDHVKLNWSDLVKQNQNSRSQKSTKFPGLLKKEERTTKHILTLPGETVTRTVINLITVFLGPNQDNSYINIVKDITTGEIFYVPTHYVKWSKRVHVSSP